MSDMPPGWARATAAYENDCNDSIPRVCRDCPDYEGCTRDWIDCDADAEATAAESRWEAARDARD
jgi:hypothetical protein